MKLGGNPTGLMNGMPEDAPGIAVAIWIDGWVEPSYGGSRENAVWR